jgi:calcineurin-like phosphoesterase family protein
MKLQMSNTFFTSDTHFGHDNIMKYCRRDKFMTAEEVALLDAADRGEIDQRKIRISPESIDRMNTAMIDNINAVVRENDVLYHIGDAFWGHEFEFAKAIRQRIKCRTIHHIWGNHDEPEVAGLFTSSEKYAEVVVDKQKIFLCHYPMRAWDKSHKGSWCLYGHVHGNNWEEDKYGLSKGDRKNLTDLFIAQVAATKRLTADETSDLVGKLLDQLAEYNCNMLTLDVGVDTHDYRPWSMDELRAELFPKIEKARLRREREKANYPAGSRKSD